MSILKHLSRRERQALYIAIFVIAGVLVYNFIIEPVIESWKGIKDNIANEELQLIKNKKILAQKDVINRLYNQYAENIKMKGSEDEETAVILREIENIARASNTHITDIKPQEVKDMEFYKEYYIKLEAEGDITSLAKFIYDLQSSKQILKVRHLMINPKGDASDILKGEMLITKILIP